MYWLRERVHPTWHFTMLAYGVVGGIALARVWQGEIVLLVFAGGILSLLAFATTRRIMLVAALVGGCCLGLARGSYGQQDQAIYHEFYNKHVIVTGVVADDIETTSSGISHVRLRNIQLDSHTLPGTVFASVAHATSAKRSDMLTIDGEFDVGFGNFPAALTGDVTKITREAGGDIPLDVRDGFAERTRHVIKEPESSLGIGYLLGQKSTLPADLQTALKVTALTHIVVASGYNLTILVRLGRRMFAKVSKYLTVLFGGTLIVGFIAMTGLSPSMTRAGLISALGLWAWYVGRKFHPATLLAVAAAVTALVNPSYVWGDLGWLLSFAAFAGVMIVAPIVSAYFFEGDVPFVGQILIETLAAQLATLPIMIMAFGQFSIIGLAANLLILPLVPLAMLLVALAGVASLAPLIAPFVAWPAQQLLSFQVAVITWCADIPWALAKPKWGLIELGLYFGALLGILGYMKWRSGVKLYEASIVE